MFTMIGAISKNNCVGNGNTLPWRIPSDLRFFKMMTENQTIIMGWNTYLSLNKRPLPNRRNIVLVRDNNYEKVSGFEYKKLHEIKNEELKNKNSEFFVIGGPKTWDLFKGEYQTAIITRVDCEIQGDSFVDDDIYQNITLKQSSQPNSTVDTSKDDYSYVIEFWEKSDT